MARLGACSPRRLRVWSVTSKRWYPRSDCGGAAARPDVGDSVGEDRPVARDEGERGLVDEVGLLLLDAAPSLASRGDVAEPLPVREDPGSKVFGLTTLTGRSNCEGARGDVKRSNAPGRFVFVFAAAAVLRDEVLNFDDNPAPKRDDVEASMQQPTNNVL